MVILDLVKENLWEPVFVKEEEVNAKQYDIVLVIGKERIGGDAEKNADQDIDKKDGDAEREKTGEKFTNINQIQWEF